MVTGSSAPPSAVSPAATAMAVFRSTTVRREVPVPGWMIEEYQESAGVQDREQAKRELVEGAAKTVLEGVQPSTYGGLKSRLTGLREHRDRLSEEVDDLERRARSVRLLRDVRDLCPGKNAHILSDGSVGAAGPPQEWAQLPVVKEFDWRDPKAPWIRSRLAVLEGGRRKYPATPQGIGPVPADEWTEGQLALYPEASAGSGSFDKVSREVEEDLDRQLHEHARAMDTADLMLSLTSAALEAVTSIGSAIGSADRLVEAVEIREVEGWTGAAPRRHVRLKSDREFVVASCAVLLHDGEVSTLREAHDRLLNEVRGREPEGALAFPSYAALRSSVLKTYSATVARLKADGLNAFAPFVRENYRR